MSTPATGVVESDVLDRMSAVADESVAAPIALSPSKLAWRRFRADRKSLVAGVIVVIYLVLAALAPLLLTTHVLDSQTSHLNLLNSVTLPTGSFGGISWSHPLGVVPGIGWDLMSRLWQGLALSMLIALSAAVLSIVIGVVLGLIAGASGGWTDGIIGRFIDLTLSFPQTLMLLSLSSIMLGFISNTIGIPAGAPAQGFYVIVVLALFGWTTMARLIRAQVMSLREREFIQAAHLFGASRRRLWFKELLPNLWAPILVTFTQMLPFYISSEAALAYLGVSILPPTPTLGNLMGDSVTYANADFAYFFIPAFVLVVIVVAFNLLGDGVRDALDPKGHR